MIVGLFFRTALFKHYGQKYFHQFLGSYGSLGNMLNPKNDLLQNPQSSQFNWYLLYKNFSNNLNSDCQNNTFNILVINNF